MPYNSITFEIDDGVGLIRLNRPNEGNSLIPEMARELLDAATRCDEDAKIRAVVLTGNGKMFCAGGDLKAFPPKERQSPTTLRILLRHFMLQYPVSTGWTHRSSALSMGLLLVVASAWH